VVLSGEGEVLHEGRDLEALQARHGQVAQREFMDRQGGDWNRDGIVAWLPGDLPEQVTTPEGTRAYPALVDQQDAVGLDGQGVRTEAEWRALLERVRGALGPGFQGLARDLDEVLKSFGRLRQALQRAGAVGAESIEDMQAQLDDMIYPDFLLELENGRLAHYPRYLQALEERFERARLDPGKDQRLLTQLLAYRRLYEDRLEAGADYTAALDRFRWLLAEYRVSVFAQRLGTAEKVSPKRLDEAWQSVLDD
jgi:ATP-dependent helicase HrpA